MDLQPEISIHQNKKIFYTDCRYHKNPQKIKKANPVKWTSHFEINGISKIR